MPARAPAKVSIAQHAFLALAAGVVLLFSTLAARWRPLWYDEIFTLRVAGQGSFKSLIAALLAGADTNPPLDYLLRHLSLALTGPSPASFRFSSAVATVAGMYAIYGYVRRRAPFVAATAAFLFPVGTAAAFFAYEGRAYALLFASAPVALLAWQRAVDRPREPASLLALVLALCLGPYAHYFGVFSVVPVCAGELWRTMARRRVDWGIAGAFATAGVLCLPLVPFASNAARMKAAFWASHGTLGDALHYYAAYLDYSGRSALFVAAGAIPLAVLGYRRATRSGGVNLPAHEIVAAVAAAITPLSAYVLAVTVTGVVTSRYAIALVPGVAILVGYLLTVVEASLGTLVAALPVALLTVSGLGHFASDAIRYRGSEPIPPAIRQLLQRSSLPVAFDSPHAYLEYVHYAPDLARSRFFYPMDADTAVQFRGFSNDEIALRGLGQIVPLNVTDYRDFITRYAEFLVLDRQDFAPALIAALPHSGFCLRVVDRTDGTVLLRARRPCWQSGPSEL